MFDISWGELILIGMVALIAIGPKELPGALRTLGQWMTKIRRMASDFQSQFQEAMREAGSLRMAQQQLQQRQAYEQAQVDTALKTSAIAISKANPDDSVTFEAARQEGLDLIDVIALREPAGARKRVAHAANCARPLAVMCSRSRPASAFRSTASTVTPSCSAA